MKMEALVTSCALFALAGSPFANGQSYAPAGGQPALEAYSSAPPTQRFAHRTEGSPRAIFAHEASFGSDQDRGAVMCAADCKDTCCRQPVWAHRTGAFGEILFLRPRNSELAFALPVDGALPVGPVGVLDQDFSAGFRGGFSYCLDECTSVVATYSQLDSSTFNFVDTDPASAIRALLLHPATTNAAADFLSASGDSDLDFQLVDAAYRSVLFGGDCFAVNYSVGARFAHLEQGLRADYSLAGTTESVVTELDFDGAGIRIGLDAERHSDHHGLHCYGKAHASFVGGEFRADYDQFSTVDPSIVDTSWQAGRLVTMLDLEIGVGWQSPGGHFRLTTGYVFSAWLNTVNTDSWIESVQNNNFVGLEDSMSFDGLTAQAEYRF